MIEQPDKGYKLDEIPLNKAFIDSFRIRIPLNDINIIDNNLGQIISEINESTGEKINEKKKKKHVYWNNGVDTHYSFTDEQFDGLDSTGEKIRREFISITITSKLFGEKYFFGVNDINKLYQIIIDQGIIYCSFDVFKDARFNDVDLKIDVNFDGNHDLILNNFRNIAKRFSPTKVIAKGCKLYNERKGNEITNLGFKINGRQTSTQASPYCKIYDKRIELLNNSKDFYDFHLKNIDCSNILRFETRVKNKRHFNFLGYSIDNRLQDLLAIDSDSFKEIIKTNFRKNLEPRKVTRLKGSTPTDKNYISLIEKLLNYGESKDSIMELLLLNHDKTCTKSKQKRKFLELFHKIETKSTYLNNNALEYSLLAAIGIE